MNGRIYEHTSGFVGADGNGNYVSLVGVGEIIGQTITALGSVKDANLRRKYEQQIGELSRIEQEKLNKELLKAQNDSDKRKIFADVLSQLNKSRIEALNKPKNNVIWYVLGGVVILTASYFIYKKLKK
jgi:hypothetical protein